MGGWGDLKSSTLTGHSTAGPRAHDVPRAQNRRLPARPRPSHGPAACGHSGLGVTFIPNHCEQDMVEEWSWYLEPAEDIWAI